MITFCKLWNVLEEIESSKLSKDGLEDSVVELIKIGLNSQIKENFWITFMELINNNASAFSDLFDVPESEISTWNAKIQKILDKVKENQKPKEKSLVMRSGNEINP